MENAIEEKVVDLTSNSNDEDVKSKTPYTE
jgi:hypothetical protein